MDSTNRLTIYDLTQPTEMHKDYGWWHILRDGCGLADVQNQHEGVKIVEELQRRADEVHWLRAEVERLRAAMLGIGLAITAYDASSDRANSDYDMVCAGGRLYDAVLGIHDSWKLGLDPQPMPAPPVEEE